MMTLIHGDARDHGRPCDLLLTDPPYDMAGAELAEILGRYDTKHLVLITTMSQFLEFMRHSDWQLNFDFVIDGVMPKKSKSLSAPNYIHQTGVYLSKKGSKTIFNRKLRQRSDVFDGGYWPTIFYAPRTGVQQHGLTKNRQAITDLLGSFDVKNVCDPFGGSGTTALAAYELGINCTIVEKDSEAFSGMKRNVYFCSYGQRIIDDTK